MKDKLEVGMYVRTDLGNIGKILEEYTHQNYKVSYPEPQEWVLDTGYILNEAMMYQNEEIIKTSHNIIDLLEVGDYVNGEKITRVIPQDICGDEVLDYQHIFVNDKEIFKHEINSIVTKEQFESIKYEVE